MDLVSPYHALLGRPALTRFMAVPHYGYLKMKLPSPKGVITITGDYRRSMDCATQSSKLAPRVTNLSGCAGSSRIFLVSLAGWK